MISSRIFCALILLAPAVLSAETSDETWFASGTVVGMDSLVKQRHGSLTLNGVNTYSGSTTINNGMLLRDFEHSIHASSIEIDLSSGEVEVDCIKLGGDRVTYPKTNTFELLSYTGKTELIIPSLLIDAGGNYVKFKVSDYTHQIRAEIVLPEPLCFIEELVEWFDSKTCPNEDYVNKELFIEYLIQEK